MCRLVETIKIQDHNNYNLEFHNERLNKSREILFGLKDKIDLNNYLKCPENINGKIKCRVVYSESIINIEYSVYKKREIKSLKMVSSYINYHHKFENREDLQSLFDLRNNCDDILIIKEGLITDTSFTNIVFFDGNNWITPSCPILYGTKRRKLIDSHIIKEENIYPDDLSRFTKASLINSMLEIGETEINISNIFN
jgi:4-amino-4-deoxychorismate lyase